MLALYHLPYDSGAVPQHLWEPGLLSGLFAFIVAVGLTGGLTFGLITLNGGFDKAFAGVKMPKLPSLPGQ